MTPKVHMVLQGKGGVGKSAISAILAQYKPAKGAPALCIDTDPINATFEGFKRLDVKRLPILDKRNEIDPRSFDVLIDWIGSSETDAVIDNGASAFVALASYLISNEAWIVLAEMGRELVIHTVITGGQQLLDTVSGFVQLVQQFPEEGCRFVVWLNPHFGSIEQDGKTFEQMKAYINNKHRISAMVQLPAFRPETHGRDLAEMLKARLTFEEAIASPAFSVMARQRLKIVQRQLFEQLDLVAAIL
jgi:hypothetical protein